MLELSTVRLKHLVFPGHAGKLQQEGQLDALVEELGANYSVYHAWLACSLHDISGFPRREDYLDNWMGFIDAADRFHEHIHAERLLRACRRRCIEGADLNEPLDGIVPLIDEGQRLLSVVTGKPHEGIPPARDAEEWKPPALPDFR